MQLNGFAFLIKDFLECPNGFNVLEVIFLSISKCLY